MEVRAAMQPTPFGQYLLLERIGSGGMAEIFRAKTFGAAGFQKEYAIKRILPNLGADEEFVEMFVNEAKLVVDLYHANIVQVFDLGEIDGSYFIAMEFVHGKDLLDLLARCTENDLKIPIKLTLYVIMEMLKGLDYAHEAKNRIGERLGIIHRDVSPSNIMLSYGGNVKVGDFGVAKAKTQTHLTEVGTLKGKVGYMSPEQVRGEDIDRRSDVFAAGIILYESLTMTRLFMGGNDLDVMLKIRDSDIEEDLGRCRKVPPSLVNIMRRALAKKREERYQSCGELHAALQNFTYKHNIKATSTDLSSFLRLVFAEEIQAEKSFELEGSAVPDLPVVEQLSRVIQSRQPIPTPPAIVGEVEKATERETGVAGPGAAPGYRYRSHDGIIQGPIQLAQLKTLLETTPEHDNEAVAIGGGSWRQIDDLPELWSIERPEAVFADSNTEENLVPDATDEVESTAVQEPSQPDVDSAYTHAGSLSQATFARLLFRLKRRRYSGKLSVISADVSKELYFRRGEPIAATSSKTEERLGSYLVGRKIITEEQLQRGLDRLAEFGGRLGDALVGERVLPTHDLFQYLTEQLQDRIRDIFTWSSADWAWFPDLKPTIPPASLGLDIVELIVASVRDHVPSQRVRRRFEGRENALLEIVHSRLDIEDLPLLPEEVELVTAVNAGTTPQQLLETLGIQGTPKEALLWRVLYYLIEFELYRLEGGAGEHLLPG